MYSIVYCACACVCVMTGVSSTVGNDCESDLLKLHIILCDPLGFQLAKFKDDLVHRSTRRINPVNHGHMKLLITNIGYYLK